MSEIIHILGARSNFMKAAPVIQALGCRGLGQGVVHTGQHYDPEMSGGFFKELGLPEPVANLGVGSGSHAAQTAQVMVRLEEALERLRPGLVLVYGDVNSTLAAALVCSKMGIKVGHVEAGLRSFDRSMPEEINRLLTDRISDLLFTPSEDASEHLRREGIEGDQVFFVGNVMIDTLVRWGRRAKKPDLPLGVGDYALVTLHRPSNVDEPAMLHRIMQTLHEISERLPVILPLHPRTRERLRENRFSSANGRLHLLEPAGYTQFLALERHARLVITDSGGVQEETTCLGVPCLTLRKNTERPITVEMGTNLLVGHDMELLKAETEKVLGGGGKRGRVPPLWDGHAAERVADVVERFAARRP